ncbi:unnamed protein product [Spirodela intermedia]|uniref:Uncharacterized protein n=1 Tax=Spirodela intermedia TaxID=51605 RepID=A0A7I8JQQ9_SPIIN|nr:unnamed protein product [Spirodela intermedia]CAA6671923.1 unnamed protein product [Spirodela intermedia]
MGDEVETSLLDQGGEKLRCLEIVLRICAPPLSIAALLLIVGNKQVPGLGERHLRGYTILAFAASTLWWPITPWIFFASDQIAAYLLVTSGSAVGEVLYLRRMRLLWLVLPAHVVSLALHFLASVCFVVLSLLSAYRLFNRFDPPPPPLPSSSKEVSGRELRRKP